MTISVWQVFPCGRGFDPQNAPHGVSKSRRILPQVRIFGFKVTLTEFKNQIHCITFNINSKNIIQFLCSFAQFLLSWNSGLVLAIPSIVVPSVIGISSNLNPDEILHMTPDEASWLGINHSTVSIKSPSIQIYLLLLFTASILFIVQPIGNLLSGFITESFGRKNAIVIINVIPAIAWIMLPNANSQQMTYIAFSLLGIGIGLTSSVTYISEIR